MTATFRVHAQVGRVQLGRKDVRYRTSTSTLEQKRANPSIDYLSSVADTTQDKNRAGAKCSLIVDVTQVEP